jgi:hypothetical protein
MFDAKWPDNKWIKTDEIRHLKTTETATDTWKIGDRTDSPSKETAKKHVRSAQETMNRLLEELDEYDDFECG